MIVPDQKQLATKLQQISLQLSCFDTIEVETEIPLKVARTASINPQVDSQKEGLSCSPHSDTEGLRCLLKALARSVCSEPFSV